MKKSAGVIGLGYVGLPLAVELCRAGYHVIGVDLDEKKVSSLAEGISYIDDIENETVASLVADGAFTPTSDYSKLASVEAMSICVPTPLRKTREPDISFVTRTADQIVKILSPGQLVILESTVFPGATEELVVPILESGGLKCGQDFFVAFSPERIDPGNTKVSVQDIPKIIGGVNELSTTKAMEFYGKIFTSVVPMNSAKEAEFAKLLENTFRAVNIGLVNELAILANQMGVNLWKVIDAAATKPFGFMPFYPGPGWGGHCIPVDPIYLSWKAKADGGEAGFIDHAVNINNKMPTYVASRVADLLNNGGLSVKGSRILLLGVSYKRDVADIRESPALSILTLFEEKGANISYHDPYIPHVNSISYWESQPLSEELLRSQDCVVITADHTNIDYEFVVKNSKMVFDTRNATRSLNGKHANVHLL